LTDSVSVNFWTGTPVQEATIWATSSSLTRGSWIIVELFSVVSLALFFSFFSKLSFLFSKSSKKSGGKSCLFLYSLLFIFVFTTLLYLSSNFKSISCSKLSHNLLLSNLSDDDFVKFSFDCLYKLVALFTNCVFDCSLADKYVSLDYLWLIFISKWTIKNTICK
jgi:hypothetical protein